jgi:hypothetical protein
MEYLLHAAAEFVVADLALVTEPAALAAAQQSLDDSGLLLLGEVHGVRENPLLIRALMQVFGLTSLALEWHEDLAPVIETFLARGTLADHPLLWSGDGRITAGHLAVLAERAAAVPLEVILFDGTMGLGWNCLSTTRRWPGASWLAARQVPARWQWPGTRILPPVARPWASRWGTTWPGDGEVSGRFASITAAAITTICNRAGSGLSALSGGRYGFTSRMTRSFSTCPQPGKR